MKSATNLFAVAGSKQNTFFDVIVAAIAKKLLANAIYSFDEWYKKKLGFIIACDW